jgi:hypothetical protein
MAVMVIDARPGFPGVVEAGVAEIVTRPPVGTVEGAVYVAV